MKRIISAIVVVMMLMSIIPATFAASTGEFEIPLAKFTYTNSNSTFKQTYSAATGVLSITGLQVRRYEEGGKSNGNNHAQYGIMFFTAKASGEYEVHFRTNNPTAISGAPEIFIREYTDRRKDAVAAATSITKSTFLGTSTSGYEGEGYFDFSKAKANVYAPITKDGKADGEVSTVNLKEGTEYFIVFGMESYSLLLNALAKKDGGVVDMIEKGLIDPTTGDKGINPETGKAYTVTDLGGHTQELYLSGIKFVPVAAPEDEDYTASFDAVEETYTTGGKGIVNTYTLADGEKVLSAGNEVALGSSINVSAPEIEGYSFLYWAKGGVDSKIVVSYTEEFTYKPNEGANQLIAVYAKEGSEVNKAEFYNANGSLIATLTTDGKTPKYPSMAGYGEASGWQLYGSDDVYEANADIAVSGNMIFVAKYAETPNKVIVNGTEYTYGDTVVMPEVDTANIFKGWKRNGEIVSVDPNYTFKAWEDATVEAVYADAAPEFSGEFVKIVLDSFEAGNEEAIMAEFIGVDEAIEKGIMFGNKKIPMKGNGNQFTIIADEENIDYIGYAIVKDGSTFTQITDGKISK